MNLKKTLALTVLTTAVLCSFRCTSSQDQIEIAAVKFAKNDFSLEDYTKREVYITMRDGVRLYTAIYAPNDSTQNYPVILKRTPYGCGPYGDTAKIGQLSNNPGFVKSGYIFVFQDMRGRWMSEGQWENVRPPYSFQNSEATDEVTDSYDTFEWLKDSLPNYSGKAGVYGNSYLGWSTLVAGVSQHPSVKAIIPMAPVTNFYFEDFSRYGIFALNYLPVLDLFGTSKPGPCDTAWYKIYKPRTENTNEVDTAAAYYDWFLNRLIPAKFTDVVDSSNFFWKNISAHPNYDDHHKKRDWIQYLDRIECPVLVVGGLNDEQNLYGITNAYKKIAQTNPHAKTVVGPWTHGHNNLRDSLYYMGDIFYGINISKQYQEEIEFPFFEYHLKGRGDTLNFKVRLFDTGEKTWVNLKKYPTIEEGSKTFYTSASGKLSEEINKDTFFTYLSNPMSPVPFVNENKFAIMAPKRYMTEDQRFVENRNDVLTFRTDVLTEDLQVTGVIKAILQFSTNLKDADLYVKIIDQYPQNMSKEENDKPGVDFNGYAQTVRIGYIRGRFRNSFENPEPFVPGKKTSVEAPLLDVCHTFKKGHQIMIQIQSSMFPLMEVNPQNWVDNIYNAELTDYSVGEHKIWGDSRFVFPVQ